MSEYIWEQQGCVQQRREEIVRCRDCVYYYEADNYHPQGNYTSRCCKHIDSYNDEVEPDGFCAWAKRKEGGDD